MRGGTAGFLFTAAALSLLLAADSGAGGRGSDPHDSGHGHGESKRPHGDDDWKRPHGHGHGHRPEPAAATRAIFFGPALYVRERGRPKRERDAFEVAGRQKATLRILNGGVDRDPGHRVSAARVELNGHAVVGPRQLRRWRDRLEVPVVLKDGANRLDVRLFSKPGARLALEIVGRGGLIRPTDEAVEAAQMIHEQLPAARLHFSQLHGRLLMVESAGVDESDDTTLPVPLAESRGVDLQARVSAMLDYLERFKDAYGLADPSEEMALAVDPYMQDPNPGKPGDPRMPLTQRLVQTHQGLRIRGRQALGHFDGLGNLHGMVTRLFPVGQTLGDKPAFGPDAALSLVAQQLDPLVAVHPELYWLAQGKLEELERAAELLWVPTSPAPEAPLRLAYQLELRRNLNMARLLVDATSGEIVEAASSTPSEWPDDGMAGLVAAPDELGASRFILSTRDMDTWYLGIGNNWVDSRGLRWFLPGERLSIDDSGVRSNRSLTYFNALNIPATAGNTWATDPSYVGSRRAATSLMASLARALSYWAGFGWQSWDGRGSTLWTSVNNNKSPTGAPQLNAWGSGGVLQIGDGPTPTGQSAASSVEVVGHEFMHNVISATSALVYSNESGAVNEALADFFGVTLTAVGDQYATDQIGDDAGWNLRDMANPARFRQPEIYSAYVVTSGDSGGVHTNSGIANKAHTLVVQGGEFGGYTVESKGVSRAAALLRGANQNGAFGPNASMEEFAVSVVGYCNLLDTLLRVFGGSRANDLCAAFEQGYRATRLYPGSSDADLALDSAQALLRRGGRYAVSDPERSKGLWLEVTNVGPAFRQTLGNYQILLADELGESIPSGSRRYSPPGCGSGMGFGFVDPGDSMCIRTSLPNGFVEGYLTGLRHLIVSFEPLVAAADVNPSNNWARMRVGSDYVLTGIRSFDAPSIPALRLVATLENFMGGFPLGLEGVYLTRSTAYGPLSEIVGEARDSLEGPVDARLYERAFPVGDIAYPDPNTVPEIEYLELPGASEIPGRPGEYEVWFDGMGGLAVLEGHEQIYVLIDSDDLADELDETNNLLCANCLAPGQAMEDAGVVVRLPLGAPVEELFPDDFDAAAAKLPSLSPRVLDARIVAVPRLNPRIEPQFPEDPF